MKEVRGQGCLRSDGSDRWQAAGNRGGAKNTGTVAVLVLPAVTVVPFLPGPALRDGFSHVLGLRIIVPEALRRLSGQLLRQRQSLVDLSILDSYQAFVLASGL